MRDPITSKQAVEILSPPGEELTRRQVQRLLAQLADVRQEINSQLYLYPRKAVERLAAQRRGRGRPKKEARP